MTAPDELERAVERLTSRLDDDEHHWSIDPREDWMLDASVFDLRLLLSERAELLAAVERMRGALEPFANLSEKFGHLRVVEVCKPHPLNPSPIIAPLLVRDLTEARAALTTGEEK